MGELRRLPASCSCRLPPHVLPGHHRGESPASSSERPEPGNVLARDVTVAWSSPARPNDQVKQTHTAAPFSVDEPSVGRLGHRWRTVSVRAGVMQRLEPNCGVVVRFAWCLHFPPASSPTSPSPRMRTLPEKEKISVRISKRKEDQMIREEEFQGQIANQGYPYGYIMDPRLVPLAPGGSAGSYAYWVQPSAHGYSGFLQPSYLAAF